MLMFLCVIDAGGVVGAAFPSTITDMRHVVEELAEPFSLAGIGAAFTYVGISTYFSPKRPPKAPSCK